MSIEGNGKGKSGCNCYNLKREIKYLEEKLEAIYKQVEESEKEFQERLHDMSIDDLVKKNTMLQFFAMKMVNHYRNNNHISDVLYDWDKLRGKHLKERKE